MPEGGHKDWHLLGAPHKGLTFYIGQGPNVDKKYTGFIRVTAFDTAASGPNPDYAAKYGQMPGGVLFEFNTPLNYLFLTDDLISRINEFVTRNEMASMNEEEQS